MCYPSPCLCTSVPLSASAYLTESQSGFVYGLDEQRPNKIFAIICEGPIDAIHIDGCAILGSEISEQQSMLLNKRKYLTLNV